MPYNPFNYNSVEDAWNAQQPQSVFNEEQTKDKVQQTVQQGLLNQALNYAGNIDLNNRPVVQNPDGTVSTVKSKSFNIDGKEVLLPTISQDGRVMSDNEAIGNYLKTGQNLGIFNTIADANTAAQQIHNQQAQLYGNAAPTAATQMAAQGGNVATRRPSTEEFAAWTINHLVNNKGYSYEDAQRLMEPRIAAYAAREKAENRAMADNLISEMQNMKIDSPKYRQAAFQLYRLDPKMGEFMLKEGIGPREQYLRGQKREDTVFANEMNFKNYLRKLGVQSERQQKAIADKIQQLVEYGGMDRNTATQMVLFGGGRNGGRRTATDDGGVSEKDYKMVTGRLKELLAKQDEGMQTNPDYRLSASEQDEFNRLSQIANLAKQQLYQKYNVGQQQPKQQAKLDPNNYYSFGPLLQDLVKRNGGMSKDVARALRARLGFNPDDNSPNNFVNQVMKREYGFSG